MCSYCVVTCNQLACRRRTHFYCDLLNLPVSLSLSLSFFLSLSPSPSLVLYVPLILYMWILRPLSKVHPRENSSCYWIKCRWQLAQERVSVSLAFLCDTVTQWEREREREREREKERKKLHCSEVTFQGKKAGLNLVSFVKPVRLFSSLTSRPTL